MYFVLKKLNKKSGQNPPLNSSAFNFSFFEKFSSFTQLQFYRGTSSGPIVTVSAGATDVACLLPPKTISIWASLKIDISTNSSFIILIFLSSTILQFIFYLTKLLLLFLSFYSIFLKTKAETLLHRGVSTQNKQKLSYEYHFITYIPPSSWYQYHPHPLYKRHWWRHWQDAHS